MRRAMRVKGRSGTAVSAWTLWRKNKIKSDKRKAWDMITLATCWCIWNSRNQVVFGRGSLCQYGDRCRFLHVTQQQPKPNPFGFGTQHTSQNLQTNQQQKSNPFGFGVQNSSQSKGGFQSPAKPFENTWTRSSVNSTTSQKTDKQAQATEHNCTDPEICKRVCAEDFKNESPVWKLTCYGHFKYLPCDITGDTSFEELRAAAYGDSRRGLNLQAIVEKERSLLKSKLLEYDNLLRNPYVPRVSSAGISGANMFSSFPAVQSNAPSPFTAVQSNAPSPFTAVQSNAPSPFPAVQSNAPSPFPVVQSNAPSPFPPVQSFKSSPFLSVQSNATLPFSSFTQPGALNNSAFDRRNNSSVTPSPLGFNQPSLSQTTGQTSNGFGFGSGVLGVPASPSTPSLNNGSMPNGNKGFGISFSQQFPGISNQPLNISDGKEQEDGSDHSIWLKEEWDIGEIPDQEPPSRYC